MIDACSPPPDPKPPNPRPTPLAWVETRFRGRLIDVGPVWAPRPKPRLSRRALFALGGFSLALALALLTNALGESAREKSAFATHLALGKDPRSFVFASGSDLASQFFLGCLGLGLGLLVAGTARGKRLGGDYRVGGQAGAAAPADPRILDSAEHVLVSAVGEHVVLAVTPAMNGELTVAGETMPLAKYVAEWGSTFVLPADARVNLDCGEVSFVVTPAGPWSVLFDPRELRPALVAWNWQEQAYTVGCFATAGLLVLLARSLPPDSRALSYDVLDRQLRPVAVLIKPPQPEPPPATQEGSASPGAAASQASPPPTRARTAAPSHTPKYARGRIPGGSPTDLPGTAATRRHLEVAQAGVLGVLRAAALSSMRSIFSIETDEAGSTEDPEELLAGLSGASPDDVYGAGGLAVVGTGWGGGGGGAHTIGLGRLGTIGRGGQGPKGLGYGRAGSRLGNHRPTAPAVTPGILAVRGALDREIIRRIVRRHLPEVAFCYEKELVRQPSLSGRVALRFTIAPSGKVVAALIDSSTLGDLRVEECLLLAVRRWDFPKPQGGGIVIATYPFQFVPAGRSEPANWN